MAETELRAPATLLGVLLFVTYGYFVWPPSWNESSRFDLTRSIVERGRLDIDPYAYNTGDKAEHGGHTYSDKAPGAALLAVPVYAAYYAYLRVTGGSLPASRERVGEGRRSDEPDYLVNPSFRRALYLCSLSVSGFAGAALGVTFFLLLGARLQVPPRRALAATAALSLGSLVFPYATMLYGHVLAAAALFGAFALLSWPPSRRRLATAGLLCGLSVMTELPTVVPAAILAVLAVLRGRRDALWFAAGAAGPAFVLLAYQAVAFGNPLRPGYALVSRPEFAAGMSRGLMGIGAPRLDVLVQMLLGRARGLLYLAPVLVLGFVGLGRWVAAALRRRCDRGAPVVTAGVVLFFLVMNAGYYMWHGGSALGPRHLIPALPFLCLGVPFAFARAGRAAAVVTGVLLAVAIANHLAATVVEPAAPLVADVLADHVYPHLLRGEVALPFGASNAGLILGLPGPASLLPLVGVWALALRVLLPLLPRTARGTIIALPGARAPAE